MDNRKNTRGGKREGAGRPKGSLNKETPKKRTIMLTDREWEIYTQRGGTRNLKRYLNLGKFRKIVL